MTGRKRPASEDAATARRALLEGLARGTGISEVLSRIEPLHPRNDTFPGERLRERFLPECDFCGRQNSKLQYAVLAAAAVHGGTEPDLLEEVACWQADDFWQYAV